MGMEEKGAGVGRCKAIGETLSGLHWLLSDIGHAVHGVGHADAVPMNRCVLITKAVDELRRKRVAPCDAQHGKQLVAVNPCGCGTGFMSKQERMLMRQQCDAVVSNAHFPQALRMRYARRAPQATFETERSRSRQQRA